MKIPKLNNLETVLTVYYSNLTLGNKELDLIFKPQKGEKMANETKTRLKSAVNKHLLKENKTIYCASEVPTKIAFEVWGIDINDIEKSFKKLKELGR